jgi:pimeloyl-ACP methyl ester carboxylesterase
MDHGINRSGPDRKSDRVCLHRPGSAGKTVGARSLPGDSASLGHRIDADDRATVSGRKVETRPTTPSADVDQYLTGAHIEQPTEFVSLGERRVAVHLVVGTESLGLGRQECGRSRDGVTVAEPRAVVCSRCAHSASITLRARVTLHGMRGTWMDSIEIEARGMTFSALADGAESQPLVLCLHGLPRNSWEWHHQIPAIAKLGFRTVAPDLRGYCPGARPVGVEAYHIDEYAQDILAIADALGPAGQKFHLMATSIGASMAWWIASRYPDRVLSLVCINIPHPGALALRSTHAADAAEQRKKFAYFKDSRLAGNERQMFERMLDSQAVPPEESEPYRRALDSDEALEAVYNFYRAIPLSQDAQSQLDPVSMPTMFVWPPGSGNISRASAEANAKLVTGPYRFEIVHDAHQPILQVRPEQLTALLVEHLREHAL